MMSGKFDPDPLERIRDVFSAYTILSKDSNADLGFVIRHLDKVFPVESEQHPGMVGRESKDLELIHNGFKAYKTLIKWDPEAASEILIERLEQVLKCKNVTPQQRSEPDQVENGIAGSIDTPLTITSKKAAKETPTTANIGYSSSATMATTSKPIPSGSYLSPSTFAGNQGRTLKTAPSTVVLSSEENMPVQTKGQVGGQIYEGAFQQTLDEVQLEDNFVESRDKMNEKTANVISTMTTISTSSCSRPIPYAEYKTQLEKPTHDVSSSSLNQRKSSLLLRKLALQEKHKIGSKGFLYRRYKRSVEQAKINAIIPTSIQRRSASLNNETPDTSNDLALALSIGSAVEGRQLRPRRSASGHPNGKSEDKGRLMTSDENEASNCLNCDKDFSSQAALKRHVVYCTKPKSFVCKYCSMAFKYQVLLNRHERIHTGDKPYKCRYCPKTCARMDYRADHERTHTGERPYSCKYCQKTFARKGTLNNHERNLTCRIGFPIPS